MKKFFSMTLLNDSEQNQLVGGSEKNPSCSKSGDTIIRCCGPASDYIIKLCNTVEARCESEFAWNSETETWTCGKYTLSHTAQP